MSFYIKFYNLKPDADTDDEAVDPTFDLDSSMKSDVDHI